MAKPQAVVITRPVAESLLWSKAIARAGFEVLAWPLIEVQAHADLMRINKALAAWHGYQAVMFVSRAAVVHAFQHHRPKAGWGLTRCWATGPGTRQALLDVGVPEGLIDSPPLQAGQFDTEALWRVVSPQLLPGRPVLLLRGSDGDKPATADEGIGRDWLMKQLDSVNLQVDSVAVYQRNLPVWDAPQQARAKMAAQDGSIWVFSSSQSVTHLAQLLPAQDWSKARALATHERIADANRQIGFQHIRVCKPTLLDIIASLESFE
ncbi:HemD Uroporphyrinogen-III synthase [Burkholderiaceae bacterium]|nr:uroporphyrinogen-III synthase [Limnohabitans sp.]